jgi:putative ABC transport system substrate-binding protein
LAKKLLAALLAVILLATASTVAAQEERKVPRVGFLSASPPAVNSERVKAFVQGLRDLGYVDGQNISIAFRSAESRVERLPQLAAELVRLKVDVIVTAGPTPTRVVKHATQTIPIVMAHDPDPVGNGFIVSLAHPGANVTGLSSLAEEISGKQLELLKETIPALAHVAVLGTRACRVARKS